MKSILLFVVYFLICANSYCKELTYQDRSIKSLFTKGLSLDFRIGDSGETQSPIIRVKINGIEFLGVIDTGSNRDVLITENVVNKLRLKSMTKRQAVLNGQKTVIYHSQVKDVTLYGFSNDSKIPLGERDIISLEKGDNKFQFFKYNNTPVDVIISLNSQLQASALQFDYLNNILTLMNHSETIDYSNSKKVPLKIVKNLPYMTYKNTNGDLVDILLDTGASYIGISGDIASLGNVKQIDSITNVTFIDLKLEGKCFLVEKFTLGELELNNIIVIHHDNARNMKFGFRGMKDKVVTIDSKRGYVYFEE